MEKYNLEVDLAGINMKNPVMPASGTFGYGEEYSQFFDLNKLGAIIGKTITLKERQGNEQPRLIEVQKGIINRIGLQNPGLEKFIEEKLPYLKKLETPLIVNISGNSLDDFIGIVKKLNKERKISGLEINISCPNVSGKIIGKDEDETYYLIKNLKKFTEYPLIVKLSPDVPSKKLVAIAQAAIDGGGDALTIANSYKTTIKHPQTGKPFTGGLSGPVIKQRTIRKVKIVYKYLKENNKKAKIIGCGGIMNWEDAVDYIRAGASAVQIGTANFVDPQAMPKVINGIRNYLIKNKIQDINKLVGKEKL